MAGRCGVVRKKPEATKTLFLRSEKLIGGGKTRWWSRDVEKEILISRAHWQFWQSHPCLDGLRRLMRQGERGHNVVQLYNCTIHNTG